MYGDESGFQEALQYRRKKPFAGKMYDIIQYNSVSVADGMSAEKINDSTLYVHFIHNGSWFMREGLGAIDYETPAYKVQMTEWGYTVTFKNFDSSTSIILYPDHLKWKQAVL
jgi:hypothetical protein